MPIQKLPAGILLFAFLPLLAGDPTPRGRAGGDEEAGKKKSYRADPAGADPVGVPRPEETPAPPALPSFKTPEAGEKFKEGMEKFRTEDYSGARTLWNACLKDASTPADKKALQGWIADTKLGLEIGAARKLAEAKSERKAIARVEAALKTNPGSSIAEMARRFIRETEDLIYNIIDDFEPGDGLEGDPEPSAPAPGAFPRQTWGSRWVDGMSLNSDPAFIQHGKGSMKWAVKGRSGGGGRGRRGPGPGPEPEGYRSNDLKDLFARIQERRWRILVFHVYLAEAEEGSLQVTLAPSAQARLADCLYLQKLIDFRGKRGWLPVRIDLLKDFGNTANAKLEEMRFIRIAYSHVNRRTIYLDFVHLE